MRRFLVIFVLFFVCVSAVFAAVHPLIGKWKFSEVVGGTRFYDYVTISAVDTTTKKVSGYWTGLKGEKFTGYLNGNIVFIGDVGCDWYYDAYYFTFQGTTPLKKHLGICSNYHDFDAAWHTLTTTKLSSSIASTEITTLNAILNQKALKKQGQLKERMTARTSVE